MYFKMTHRKKMRRSTRMREKAAKNQDAFMTIIGGFPMRSSFSNKELIRTLKTFSAFMFKNSFAFNISQILRDEILHRIRVGKFTAGRLLFREFPKFLNGVTFTNITFHQMNFFGADISATTFDNCRVGKSTRNLRLGINLKGEPFIVVPDRDRSSITVKKFRYRQRRQIQRRNTGEGRRWREAHAQI